jgi:hypothetical protein
MNSPAHRFVNMTVKLRPVVRPARMLAAVDVWRYRFADRL